MLFISWLSWWYGRGWIETGASIRGWVTRIYLDFSVPLLLRTLFAPWRRLVTGKSGSFDQQLRAMLDNTISRFVGLGVRLAALIAALSLITLGGLGGLILLGLWPLIPLAGVVLLVIGLAV